MIGAAPGKQACGEREAAASRDARTRGPERDAREAAGARGERGRARAGSAAPAREAAGSRDARTGEERRTHWHPAVPGFPVAVSATRTTAVPV